MYAKTLNPRDRSRLSGLTADGRTHFIAYHPAVREWGVAAQDPDLLARRLRGERRMTVRYEIRDLGGTLSIRKMEDRHASE